MNTKYILIMVFVLLGIGCQEAQTDRAGRKALDQKLPVAVEPPNIRHSIGVATTQKDSDLLCLVTANPNITDGTQVYLVANMFFLPEKIVGSNVEGKLQTSCDETSRIHDKQDSTFYYRLRLSEPPTDELDTDLILSIALINLKKAPSVVDEHVVADLDGDGQNEHFKHCGGYEGSHLTAWKGKPLTGTRIWHYFYYAGYDTEFTCTEKEVELIGTDDGNER